MQLVAAATYLKRYAALTVIEIVAVYFSWLYLYPLATVGYIMDQPLALLSWLVCGCIGFALLTRARAHFLRKLWFALVFMPTTIICGSWALVPWPLGVVSAFGASGCSTIASLVICLLLNILLVQAIAWVVALWRNKPRAA